MKLVQSYGFKWQIWNFNAESDCIPWMGKGAEVPEGILRRTSPWPVASIGVQSVQWMVVQGGGGLALPLIPNVCWHRLIKQLLFLTHLGLCPRETWGLQFWAGTSCVRREVVVVCVQLDVGQFLPLGPEADV